MVYHIQEEEKLVKKKDEYECGDSTLLLKTFAGIRNKTVGLGRIEDFTTISGGMVSTRPTALTTKQSAADGGADQSQEEYKGESPDGDSIQ